MRDGETKWIFKQTFSDRLPSDAVWRPKQGFEIPVDDWLRQPLRNVFESSVLAPNSRVADAFEQSGPPWQRAVEYADAGALGRALVARGNRGLIVAGLLADSVPSESSLSEVGPVRVGIDIKLIYARRIEIEKPVNSANHCETSSF